MWMYHFTTSTVGLPIISFGGSGIHRYNVQIAHPYNFFLSIDSLSTQNCLHDAT